jgi:hypothetical protein
MHFLLSLVLAQAALILPLFGPGSELRFVSPDLLSVYASGSVSEDLELRIDLPLAAGTEVRLVIFPPNADDAAMAEALAPASRHLGRVAEDRNDIDVLFAGAEGVVSLRAYLQEEYGVRLILVTRR